MAGFLNEQCTFSGHSTFSKRPPSDLSHSMEPTSLGTRLSDLSGRLPRIHLSWMKAEIGRIARACATYPFFCKQRRCLLDPCGKIVLMIYCCRSQRVMILLYVERMPYLQISRTLYTSCCLSIQLSTHWTCSNEPCTRASRSISLELCESTRLRHTFMSILEEHRAYSSPYCGVNQQQATEVGAEDGGTLLFPFCKIRKRAETIKHIVSDHLLVLATVQIRSHFGLTSRQS